MPLKPGQKQDLKVEIQKLKGLNQLQDKIEDLLKVMSGLSYGKNTVNKNLKKEFSALQDKVQQEITATNTEIIKLKNTQPKTNTALDKLVKAIAKECSQALGEYRKTKLILLRGVQNGASTAFMGRSRIDRESKDSSQRLQEIYDTALKSKGFKALRGNSIFTTTDEGFAQGYGSLYYIFPKNGFSYTWSKHEKDLVLEIAEQVLEIEKIERITLDVETWYEKKFKRVLEWPFEDPYEALYDLEGFFKSMAKLKYPKAKNITILDLINWDYIKNDIGPVATNFSAGLKSGNEMLISGEYYAVRANSLVAEHIIQALKLKSQVDY